MLLVKMASKDLWRRKFRTILTLVALGFSYGMTLWWKGLGDGGHEQWAEIAIRLKAGHVVIQGKGYNEERVLDLRVARPEVVEKAIRKHARNVRVVQRVFATGSLRSPDGSVMLDQLVGVQPVRESRVSDIPKKIIKGKYLTGGPGEIVIGVLAAERLKVRVGDKVVLTASGLQGRVQERFRVKGIFKTFGNNLDRGYALISLTNAQKFLGMGKSVTQVAVFADLERSTPLARKLRGALDGTRGLEVLDWEQALPMMAQFIWVDDASMWLLLMIIFAIVGAGVTNAVLMSVMERTRQFGVLKALGMGPGKVVQLILTEAAIVGVLAVAVGLALGLPLNHLMETRGIDLSIFTGGGAFDAAGVPITGVMYAKLHWISIVWTACAVWVITMLAAIYPAIRAARIVPVEAIHRL